MNIIEILTLILIVLASALCIALISFRYQVGKSVRSIKANIQELSSQFKPHLKSTQKYLNELIYIINQMEPRLQTVKSIVINIRERADTVLKTEAAIRNWVENAVMPIVKNINAVGIGMGSFWRNYKADKQKKYI